MIAVFSALTPTTPVTVPPTLERAGRPFRDSSPHGTLNLTTAGVLAQSSNIGTVLIGEASTFHGGHDWLAEHGVAVSVLDDPRCVALMTDFIAAHPALWNEDIGVAPADENVEMS